jgi:deoxyribonuclease II
VEEKSYQIHNSQCLYGQSMVCMSLNIGELTKVGQQLMYTYPQVYDHFIPESIQNSPFINNLLKVINGNHVTTAPWFNINEILTRGGEQLTSYAKFTNFEDDLYAGLLMPSLKSNLVTETWNNGPGTLPSNCSVLLPYHVYNIEELSFELININFTVHHDHSKWALTVNNMPAGGFGSVDLKRIACIGDINRQEEQYRR